MKTIEIKVTDLELQKITFKASDAGKFASTLDMIEVALDNIPQGGFTPKDIRDRNRIQDAIDKEKDLPGEKVDTLSLEDSDYENLKSIVHLSRWVSRDKALQEFLDTFK